MKDLYNPLEVKERDIIGWSYSSDYNQEVEVIINEFTDVIGMTNPNDSKVTVRNIAIKCALKHLDIKIKTADNMGRGFFAHYPPREYASGHLSKLRDRLLEIDEG